MLQNKFQHRSCAEHSQTTEILVTENCARSRVHFEHHSVAQWFDNILTVEWHNYQQMHCSATGQNLLGLETNCKIQPCCQGMGLSFTWISCIVSSSLVSVFFSIPSPRSWASRVVLSEVNPSFFRGRSTSEKQNTLTVCVSPRQLTSRRTEMTSRRLTDFQAYFYLEGEFFKFFFYLLRIPI